MTVATRDSILQVADLPRESIVVPEWGGQVVWVRTLTGAEHDAYTASSMRVDPKTQQIVLVPDNKKARYLTRCICDEKGERIFSDEDADALGKKSILALDRIYEVARQLNGIGPDVREEIRKNSAGEASDGSASGSPSGSASPTSTASSGA